MTHRERILERRKGRKLLRARLDVRPRQIGLALADLVVQIVGGARLHRRRVPIDRERIRDQFNRKLLVETVIILIAGDDAPVSDAAGSSMISRGRVDVPGARSILNVG